MIRKNSTSGGKRESIDTLRPEIVVVVPIKFEKGYRSSFLKSLDT